jgi:hydrogenase large subunit
LHFYHLALLDYVHGPAMAPWTPALQADQRFSEAEAATFADHYVKALEMRRKAQEMGALFAGKLPHVMTFAVGGVTQQPTSDAVTRFRWYLDELVPFVENVYVPDVMKVAERYPEYLEIGSGPRNLLSFGAFPDGSGGQLFAAGKFAGPGHAGEQDDRAPRRLLPLTSGDLAAIDESVKHAYYGGRGGRDARADATTPNLDKPGAYSWVKAPRLGDVVYQVGALARMFISGSYRGGISAMDRLLANAYETEKVAAAMRDWLDGLALDASGYRNVAALPAAGSAVAVTEAPRGALAHWLQYSGGKVTAYRIITPTSWNASPRDDREAPGPLEQALVGVRVADRSQPIEVYRVIHSFDPCMGCAVHVTVV